MCAAVGLYYVFFDLELEYCLLVVLMELGVVTYTFYTLRSSLWGKCKCKTWDLWLEWVESGFHRSLVGSCNKAWLLCCVHIDQGQWAQNRKGRLCNFIGL